MNRHTSSNGCYKRRRASISTLSSSSSSMLLLAFAVTAPPAARGLIHYTSNRSPPLRRPLATSTSSSSFASQAAAAKLYSTRQPYPPSFHPSSSFCGGKSTRATTPRQNKSFQLFMSADPLSGVAAAAATATAARKAALGASSASPAASAAAQVARQAASAGTAATSAAAVGTAAAMPTGRIAVSIDRPLMTDGILTYTSSSSSSSLSSKAFKGSSGVGGIAAIIGQALSTAWSKPVVRVALLVLVTGLALSFLLNKQQQQQANSSTSESAEPGEAAGLEQEEEEASSSSSTGLASTLSSVMRRIKGRFQRVLERFEPQPDGVPMPFIEANEGWGVCTLASRKRLGKSSFVKYDFDLPQSDYVLPLDLGQQVSMCCLDNEGNVARGDFFPYSPNAKSKPGSFSVLLSNHKSPDKNIFAMGLDAANFARVVKNELKIGDEVALKPGKHRLAYRGQYLPVTDMVYVAFGTGIVPVLDQIRAVLPSGTSSVKSVTVVWINEATRDFDVTAAILEKEYFKYSQKLAVSCIVDDLHYKEFGENSEVNDAIPNFELGAMAVVAGPAELKDKAMSYLEERGYPRDTICVL